MLLPGFYLYPNLLEGTDCLGGQLCIDKEADSGAESMFNLSNNNNKLN